VWHLREHFPLQGLSFTIIFPIFGYRIRSCIGLLRLEII
jgi:hypothetical protein